MKELEKMLISTKESLKSHLTYKLIREADLNLLNRSKADFNSAKGSWLNLHWTEFICMPITRNSSDYYVFCQLMSISTEL